MINYKKYLFSIYYFFTFLFIVISSLFADTENNSNISFKKVIKYYPLLPQLINPFVPEEKTLSLVSSHPFWNGKFLNATKKLRKIKKTNEFGLIPGTFIIYNRYLFMK